MQKAISQHLFLDQPPAEVWEYLTKPELLELWLMKSDFKPMEGHQFRFTYTTKNGDGKGVVNCEVLEVKPHSRLSYSWNGVMPGDDKPFNSKVEWTLLPKGNGTELQVQHNGFIELDQFTSHNSGWAECLKGLGKILTAK